MNRLKTSFSNLILNKAFGASIILIILIVSIFWNPEKGNLVPCFFREITGHSCPSCGLSRSFFVMSHLHILESFKFHLMGPIIYVSILLLFLKFSIELVTKKEIQIKFNPLIGRIFIGLFICLWVAYWIFKLINES